MQGIHGPIRPQGPIGPTGAWFIILGYFDTYSELETSITSPSPGDAYGVGTDSPRDVYVWDGVSLIWVNEGTIQGPMGPQGAHGLTTSVNNITQINGNVTLTGESIPVMAGSSTDLAQAVETIPTTDEPLAIDRGGTGATTAIEAQAALGLKSGATCETQHGAVTMTMLPNETASIAMTFPKPFSGTPHISLGLNNNTPYNKRISLSNPTATGATFYCDYTGAATGASVTIHWIAAY